MNLDLVALVADADMQNTLKTLLAQRAPALGIRSGLRYRTLRHPQRDPGVVHQAAAFLRPYLGRAQHALVMLDWEGSGAENRFADPEGLEADLETALARNGWPREQAAAIVIQPELEVWTWASLQHLAQVIALPRAAVRAVLAQVERDEHGKPLRPKETLGKLLRAARHPHSPALFVKLAQRVGLQRCQDRAFHKLRATLQRWFPAAYSARPPES